MNLNVETRYIHKLYNNSFHNGNSFDIELAVSVQSNAQFKLENGLNILSDKDERLFFCKFRTSNTDCQFKQDVGKVLQDKTERATYVIKLAMNFTIYFNVYL